jgi:GDP-L-fucose synthase
VEQIFHLGSGAEYDRRHYHPRLIEEDFGAHIPADDYGLSKYCMSELASSTDNITVFRIFGVFGPYEDHEFRFISNAIVKNLLGIPITIQQNVNFDYVWAPDIARILEKMLGVRTKFRHYNLCTGRSTDLKHLAELVNEISGKPVPVIIVNPGMNTEYTGDNSRLMNELNGFDFTTMNEAIAVLFRYYRQLLPKLDPNVIIADTYASRCDIKR